MTVLKPLPLIVRPKSGGIVMTSPGFPTRCPVCNGKRTAILGESLHDRECTFACGGGYKRAADTPAGTKRIWEGTCGKSE